MGRSVPLLTRTMGVFEATIYCSSGGRGAGGGAPGSRGTADLDLPAVCSSAPGIVCSGLRVCTLVPGGSPLRSDTPEAVASEDGRDSCLPGFFLPFVVPTVPVLLETVSFEALGRDEVDEVDGEADALEPVGFFE